ncbi:MAG: hypothetical protein M3Y54_19675, partial [Bacteroidota bacterium]|nr:hypothetical protein [Bacteroidota bacterium]
MKKTYSSPPATQPVAAATRPLAALRRTSVLLLAALGFGLGAQAQTTAPQFFRADAEARGAAAGAPLTAALFHSQALTLDVSGLR